jgi:hypothetical protein
MANLITPQRLRRPARPTSAKRVVFLAMAVAAGLLTTGIQSNKGLAAGECIEQPNRDATPGAHWYYRTDHASGLKCWYLKEPQAMTPQAEAPKVELPSTQAVLQQDIGTPPLRGGRSGCRLCYRLSLRLSR